MPSSSTYAAAPPVRDEDVARLSPLGHAHLNCLGRYAVTTQPPAELRPLRDPAARDAEEDEFQPVLPTTARTRGSLTGTPWR
jgi:hypothetical protein